MLIFFNLYALLYRYMYSGILFSEIAIERIGLWNGYNSENPITYSFLHTPSEGQEHGGP